MSYMIHTVACVWSYVRSCACLCHTVDNKQVLPCYVVHYAAAAPVWNGLPANAPAALAAPVMFNWGAPPMVPPPIPYGYDPGHPDEYDDDEEALEDEEY